jgi:hypothetical protein
VSDPARESPLRPRGLQAGSLTPHVPMSKTCWGARACRVDLRYELTRIRPRDWHDREQRFPDVSPSLRSRIFRDHLGASRVRFAASRP